MVSAIRLENKIKEMDQPWSPVEVARVNDQVVRMSFLKGEYHWHKHVNEDGLFYMKEKWWPSPKGWNIARRA